MFDFKEHADRARRIARQIDYIRNAIRSGEITFRRTPETDALQQEYTQLDRISNERKAQINARNAADRGQG